MTPIQQQPSRITTSSLRFPVKLPVRRSLRLKGFDYAQPGPYFITVIVQDGRPLFGEVVDEEVLLNDAGKMVRSVWEKMPSRFPAIKLDAFVVMPNHFHGIVWTSRAADPIRTHGTSKPIAPAHTSVTLGDVVSAFKSVTTAEYARQVRLKNWRAFRRRLWQRGYYDHIVRNDESLNEIRKYILGNPTLWSLGRRHPV